MRLVADFFLLLGALFMFLGALGLIRMPDVFSRIQAGTKAATLGALCFLISIALFFPAWWPKLLVIAGFIMFTNPVGSSTIARSVYLSGTLPWTVKGSGEKGARTVVEEKT